jgi:peroxiredoxin
LVGAALLSACAPVASGPAPVNPPVTAVTAPFSPAPSAAPVALHQAAPDVAFMDNAGARHTLAEFKGKFVVLVFFAHWCGICQKELPHLAQFQSDYKDKNAVVVPIEATGADLDLLRAFGDRYNIHMPLYADPSLASAQTYLVDHYPWAYVITPNFVVQEQVLGESSPNYYASRYALYMTSANGAATTP